MIRGKIFEILGGFSEAELRKFGDFARSPYFNKNKKIVLLSDIIIPNAPDFASPELEKPQLFSALYPGKEYKDSVIRTLMSGLSRLAEKFIIHSSLEGNNLYKERLLSTSFRQRHLYTLFERKLSGIKSLLDKSIVSGDNYSAISGVLREVCELNNIRYLEDVRKVKGDSVNAFIYSKLNYYSTFLRICKEMLSHNLSYKYELDGKLMAEFARIGSEIETDPVIKEKHPAIYVEYLCCMLLVEYKTESSYYKRILDYISKFKKVFGAEELHNKYLVIFGYCTRRLDSNAEKFLGESLRVIQMMEEDTIQNIPYMEPNSFEAIASCIISSGDRDRLIKFLDRNIKKLPIELRDNTGHFLLGRMYYHKKEYDKALEHLSKVKFLRIHHYTHSKVVMAQIFYSLGEYDNCLISLDLLKRYLRRKEIVITDTYELMNNFANHASRLAVLAGKPNKKNLLRLEKDISDMKESVLKVWLLKGIKELK